MGTEEKEKKERDTEIILHISKDSKDYLEESKISELLNKYNKFMPHPIKFGTKEETIPGKEGEKEEKVTVDNIINNPNPAWTKPPADLKDEDYKQFYRELYPYQFEEPLFHIHLNVDYPFNLTGILYFPKISNDLNLQKDRIQLYQNQVFVTDNVEGIVPEFLGLLKGVIDSPDIPLNVSRSYLQSDASVKKITNYITRKVADKLNSIFKNERENLESKWNDIKVVIEYGMLTEDKFYDKAESFNLYPTVNDKYLTYEELEKKIKKLQTDKDGNLIILYAQNKDEQYTFIESAKEKGYEVLLLDSPIIPHLMQKLESKKEKIKFSRVDSDTLENLIKKDEEVISKLTDEEKEKLKPMIETAVENEKYTVQLEALDSNSMPFMLAQPEFMRRMKEMQQSSNKHGQGDLKGISQDIKDVISDLSKSNYTRNTKNKQRRILSRMLDSQTSLSQRGYKEERKSYSSNESTIYSSSSGLPEDLGQRQRLAIARAFYKDSPIIILDEATSALDSKTEELVMKSINGLRKNITIIMIAHRLQTLENCDYILEIKNKQLIKYQCVMKIII